MREGKDTKKKHTPKHTKPLIGEELGGAKTNDFHRKIGANSANEKAISTSSGEREAATYKTNSSVRRKDPWSLLAATTPKKRSGKKARGPEGTIRKRAVGGENPQHRG